MTVEPAFVTFTGLDAHTDLDRAEALSRRFPIEWGVLFSPKHQGVGRYPPLDAVGRFLDRPLRLAAHICGGHARSVLRGEVPEGLGGLLSAGFARFQVNTSDPAADPAAVAAFAAGRASGGIGILQARAGFPDDARVAWLFDRSGGRGEAPESWPVPSPDGPAVGYAGGLGPETVGAALAAIRAGHPAGRPWWIDMETRIRTDDRLDLDACEAVCRTVYGEDR